MKRPRPTFVLWSAAAVFLLAGLLISVLGAVRLVPGVRLDASGGAVSIEGPRLREMLPPGARGVGNLADGIRLYADNDLAFRAIVGRDEPTSLWIVARGRPLDGVWPLLTVHVDRRHRAGLFVTSREWGLYRVVLDLPRAEHHVRLRYANDDSRFPTNRDLDLARISVGDAPRETGDLIRWSAPVAVTPAHMSEQVFAEPAGDRLLLRAGGRAAELLHVPRGGLFSFGVRASVPGSAGSLELRVGGRTRATFEFRGEETQAQVAEVPLVAGWTRVELRRVDRSASAPVMTLHSLLVGEPERTAERRIPVLGNGALVIPAVELETDAGRTPTDGRRTLWSNGHLRTRIIAPESGRWRIALRGRGESCDGEGPRVLVLVGDDQWGPLRLDGGGIEEPAIEVTLFRGLNEILLVYDNDKVVPGVCDRNLHVEALRFEPGR